MDEIRKQIQEIDQILIEKIAKRMELSQELGSLKKDRDLAIVDEEREKELFTFWRKTAEEKTLRPEFIEKLWIIILEESIHTQES